MKLHPRMFQLCTWYPNGRVLFSTHVEFEDSMDGLMAAELYVARLEEHPHIAFDCYQDKQKRMVIRFKV
jgi:hypothetical protein